MNIELQSLLGTSEVGIKRDLNVYNDDDSDDD